MPCSAKVRPRDLIAPDPLLLALTLPPCPCRSKDRPIELIAKIESYDSIINLDQIIMASDGGEGGGGGAYRSSSRLHHHGL